MGEARRATPALGPGRSGPPGGSGRSGSASCSRTTSRRWSGGSGSWPRARSPSCSQRTSRPWPRACSVIRSMIRSAGIGTTPARIFSRVRARTFSSGTRARATTQMTERIGPLVELEGQGDPVGLEDDPGLVDPGRDLVGEMGHQVLGQPGVDLLVGEDRLPVAARCRCRCGAGGSGRRSAWPPPSGISRELGHFPVELGDVGQREPEPHRDSRQGEQDCPEHDPSRLQFAHGADLSYPWRRAGPERWADRAGWGRRWKAVRGGPVNCTLRRISRIVNSCWSRDESSRPSELRGGRRPCLDGRDRLCMHHATRGSPNPHS